MRKIIFGLWVLVILSAPSSAATYYVDAELGSTPQSSNFCFFITCFGNGFESKIYTFHPGDTVDFGQVTFFPASVTLPYPQTFSQTTRTYYYNGNVGVGFGGGSFFVPLDVSFGPLDGYSADLSYVMPDNTTQIQIAMVGNFAYQPGSPVLSSAVPEPSTWAMLLIGFAGIGLMAYRRKPRSVLIAA